MDEIDFTLNGERHHLTRQAVILAMQRQAPGRIQTYAVEVDGVSYPVKQVLASALQVPVTAFVSTRAQDLLTKLGFAVTNVEMETGRFPQTPRTVRLAALEMAIRLHAAHGSADRSEVLRTAETFAAWVGENAG